MMVHSFPKGWVWTVTLLLAACGSEWPDAGTVVTPETSQEAAHVAPEAAPATTAPARPSRVDLVRPPVRQARVPASPPIARVIVVGDSISVSWGASTGELGYAPLLYRNDDERYPAYEGRDLVHRFGGPMAWLSVAHPGDEAADVVRNQLPRLTNPHDPAYLGPHAVHGHSIVLLTVGGNDLKNQFRPAAGSTALRALDAHLRTVMAFFRDKTRFPDGVSIYFANVYDVSDGEDQFYQCLPGLVLPGLSATVAQWSNAYTRVASDYDATLIDAWTLFRGHGFNYANRNNPHYQEDDPSLWIYDRDCIHPNNRGHHMLRAAFWHAINAHPPR